MTALTKRKVLTKTRPGRANDDDRPVGMCALSRFHSTLHKQMPGCVAWEAT